MKNDNQHLSANSASIPSAVSAFTFLITLVSCLLTIDSFSQDTINRKGEDGRKQGYWIITGSMKATPGFKADQKIEEGKYVDDKKNGEWISYYLNGKIKSKIEFKNNRANGVYSTYYESGCIEEEGIWINNRNVGLYKRYTTRNDSCGILVIDKIIDKHEEKKYVRIVKPEITNNSEIIYNSKDTIRKLPKSDLTIKDGYNKIFDDQKRISMDGIFKHGTLQTGKHYVYDKNGLLLRIVVYKEGKYVGDAEID